MCKYVVWLNYIDNMPSGRIQWSGLFDTEKTLSCSRRWHCLQVRANLHVTPLLKILCTGLPHFPRVDYLPLLLSKRKQKLIIIMLSMSKSANTAISAMCSVAVHVHIILHTQQQTWCHLASLLIICSWANHALAVHHLLTKIGKMHILLLEQW